MRNTELLRMRKNTCTRTKVLRDRGLFNYCNRVNLMAWWRMYYYFNYEK